ncbi:hypothetical protein SAMN05216196_101571 [Lutimaribacter pacificus]|uniref:Uncharacterized protein n=1 Tax=Lutimaribacter pacificus TaxID=391948 RepID=A0A1H0BGW8_9RHOB|nr:hypothetical protein [Lutimaribacter pacificus]SDN44886.1 hypothetical protein SAMN05216196_101571 [Lutimaribacter pacificus]SHJ56246.1 hypothetical protein SAMN05444142_101646 [Lutimaribacter pacificus]
MSRRNDVSEAPARVMPRRVVPREKAPIAPVAQRKLHVVQGGPVSAGPVVDDPAPGSNRKAIHAFPELAPLEAESETLSDGAPLAAYLLTAVICGTVGGVTGLILFGTIWEVALAYLAAGSAGLVTLALFLLCRRRSNAPEAGRNRLF